MTTQQAWRAKLPFLEKSKPIRHRVGDTELNFYPSSIGVVFKTKEVLAPVFKALTVLFSKHDNDYGTISRDIVSPTDPKQREAEIVAEGVKLDLAEFRSKERNAAMDTVLGAINDNNLDTIGALIMDSLREVFPSNENNPPPREFIGSLHVPDIVSMLWGVTKANKGVFGPLGDRLLAAAEKVISDLSKRAGSPLGTIHPPQGASIPGPNSKINSAGSPSGVSATPLTKS